MDEKKGRNVSFAEFVRSESFPTTGRVMSNEKIITWRDSNPNGQNNPHIGYSTPNTPYFQDPDSIKERSDATHDQEMSRLHHQEEYRKLRKKRGYAEALEEINIENPHLTDVEEKLDLTRKKIGLGEIGNAPPRPFNENNFPRAAIPYKSGKKTNGRSVSNHRANIMWEKNCLNNQSSSGNNSICVISGGKSRKGKKSRKSKKSRKIGKSKKSRKNRGTKTKK